jgi:hypothetical protein
MRVGIINWDGRLEEGWVLQWKHDLIFAHVKSEMHEIFGGYFQYVVECGVKDTAQGQRYIYTYNYTCVHTYSSVSIDS